MKKRIFLITSAAMLFCLSAPAQFVHRFSSSDPAFTSLASPKTTLTLRVTIKKESVRSGPYARYAQRLLGIAAPLTDKDTYSIESAALIMANLFPTNSGRVTTPNLKAAVGVSLTHRDTAFVKVSPDRTQLTAKSAEEMARDAANTIFRLRKQRMDLISGELGENVFGVGLSVALREIDRLENEHLALFAGKHSAGTEVKYFSFVPTAGKFNYVVARFSPAMGALPDNDLSGDPIMVVMEPESVTHPAPAKGSSKSNAGTAYRIANMTTCRVMSGTRELAMEVLPIYQFGVTIETGK